MRIKYDAFSFSSRSGRPPGRAFGARPRFSLLPAAFLLATLLFPALFQGALPAQIPTGGSPSGAPPRIDPYRPAHTDTERLRSFLNGYFSLMKERLAVPGLVFILVGKDRLLFARGFGRADLEGRRPVQPDRTVLALGTLSRAATTLGLLKLYAEGRFSLRESLAPRLPEVRFSRRTLPAPAFSDLIYAPRSLAEREFDVFARDESRIQDLVGSLSRALPRKKNLPYAPGGKAEISGRLVAHLSGALIEKISGREFSRFMRRNFFAPLGMRDTSFHQPLPAAFLSRRMIGYAHHKKERRAAPFAYVRRAPEGALLTTGLDMSRLMIALLNDGIFEKKRVFSEKIPRLAFAVRPGPHPDLAGIAPGFLATRKGKIRVLYADGDAPGVRSRLIFIPEAGLGMFLFYNSSQPELRRRAMDDVLEFLLPASKPDSNSLRLNSGKIKEKPIREKEALFSRLSAYQGDYYPLTEDGDSFADIRFLLSGMLRISIRDYKLVIKPLGGEEDSFGGFPARSRWLREGPGVFVREDGRARLAFQERGERPDMLLYTERGRRGTYRRARWFESYRWTLAQVLIWGLGSVGMIGVILLFAPLGLVWKTYREQKNPSAPWSEPEAINWPSRFATLFAALTAGFNLWVTFFAYRAIFPSGPVMAAVPSYAYDVSENIVRALNSFQYSALALLILLPAALWSWIRSWWNLPRRIHFTVFVLCCVLHLWLLLRWNWLGYPPFLF